MEIIQAEKATVQVFSLLCFLLGPCLACIQCSSFLCLHHTRQWNIIAGIKCQFPTVDIIAIERQRTNKIKYMRFICETSNICDMPKYFKVCVYSEKCILHSKRHFLIILYLLEFFYGFSHRLRFSIYSQYQWDTHRHTHTVRLFSFIFSLPLSRT